MRISPGPCLALCVKSALLLVVAGMSTCSIHPSMRAHGGADMGARAALTLGACLTLCAQAKLLHSRAYGLDQRPCAP